LTVHKENYASKVEELDVLRAELDEMKSRPSLLGACTSCPVLHEKLDVLLVYARSLEAQLKAPIPTVDAKSAPRAKHTTSRMKLA
jgi:hypothetical protein